MGYDISEKLVVGVSSRALFDLEAEDRIYKTDGVDVYRRHQIEHADEVLRPGVGYPFVKRLISLNRLIDGYAPIEVILLSRNDPDTGLRVLNSIKHFDLGIERSAFLGGASRAKYLKPFNVALFLSANTEDVRAAVAEGYPAGEILPRGPVDDDENDTAFRLAFDFDGVLADDEAERIFAEDGLGEYERHEHEMHAQAMTPGPLHRFLHGISEIQRREMEQYSDDPEHEPVVRTAVMTSRAAPAHLRAVKTLRSWGIRVDEALFLGGVKKKEFLEEFRPHIFFDDQLTHLDPSLSGVSAVHIPYGVRN
jgi:5'-nucleotidase